MKNRTRITLSVFALAVVSLACSLTIQPPATTQPPPPANTPELPTAEQVPSPLPLTEPPPPITVTIPAGLVTAKDTTVTLYDSNGAQLSQLELPQLSSPDSDRVHIAGKVPANGQVTSMLYFSFGDGDSLLYRDGAGQIFSLVNGTSFLGLAGALGQPVVAFSQIDYLENYSLRSSIYAGSLQSLPSAAPVSVIDDPESWAIKPLIVEAENNVPTKVWYTRIAYGIGGDIVFEPRKGLFVLDLATGQASTILDNNISPWSVSSDKNLLAFAAAETQTNSMCIKNLGTGAELCYPALPASEPRGVGDAFISPDAQYVAWMEGDGWQMAEVPNFKTTVRVGQNNGAIIADLPMDSFEAPAGIGRIGRANPVGWLDNQTVLIQVRGSDQWDNVAVLKYNVVNRETGYLAPGTFVGLLYP